MPRLCTTDGSFVSVFPHRLPNYCGRVVCGVVSCKWLTDKGFVVVTGLCGVMVVGTVGDVGMGNKGCLVYVRGRIMMGRFVE